MRRVIILAVALFAIGCSSRQSLPAPGKISPQIFQRNVSPDGWIFTPLNTRPTGLVVDANHQVWAISSAGTAGSLSTIAMNQHVTTFPLSFAPSAITIGSDQNFWITGGGFGSPSIIARVTPAGSETDFTVKAGRRAGDIVGGSDGALWFTACSPTFFGGIGRITTDGSQSFYPSHCQEVITSGPDGNLWFGWGKKIYSMTTQGVLVGRFSDGIRRPHGFSSITTGLDGAMYLTSGEFLIKVTTDGTVTNLGTSPYRDHLNSIVSGPDGNLWISAIRDFGRLEVYNPATSTWLARITSPGFGQIVVGPDGNLWLPALRHQGILLIGVETYVRMVMTVAPKQLTVPVGQDADINVSEANYAGQWTAASNDTAVATVTSNSQNGTFIVTGVAPGTTKIIVSDSVFNSVQMKVIVTP
jgi:streptogramin lyase